jgi:hypothetical protein
MTDPRRDSLHRRSPRSKRSSPSKEKLLRRDLESSLRNLKWERSQLRTKLPERRKSTH